MGRHVFYGFNEVAQCQIGWNTEDGLFLQGEERSILWEVMKSNILERGGLWDIICLGGERRFIESSLFLEQGIKFVPG